MIKAKATNTLLEIKETETLTTGRVGIPLQLELSEHWEGLDVTVVCCAGAVHKDILVTESADLVIPHECLATPNVRLYIGVYGALSNGTVVIPTIYADAGMIISGADPSGDESYPPSPDITEQLRTEIATKQDKLTAGEHIDIDENNVISVTGDSYTVDQEYNPESSHAQSGTAVAEAVYPKADKSTTYTKSEINAQMQNKQAKFADVESEKYVVAEEVFFVGDYRVMPQYSEPNVYDIVNREMLENHHDNSKANKSTVDNHIADTNNPHAVTKTQVGLGNVDNTADVDKPISRATEAALETKQGNIASVGDDAIVFDDTSKPVMFLASPSSNAAPTTDKNLTTKKYVDDNLSNKLTEPSSGLAVGKYFRVASIDANGHAVLECVDPPTAPVQSVSAAGTALPPDASGNVDIPAAQKNVSGLVMVGKWTDYSGIATVGNTNYLILLNASDAGITGRKGLNVTGFGAIDTRNFDFAVKAAMTDGIGAVWTDAERLAALLRMGCTVDNNGFVKWTAQPTT